MEKVNDIRGVELEIKSRKEKNIKLTDIPEEINEILKRLKMEKLSDENLIKKLI